MTIGLVVSRLFVIVVVETAVLAGPVPHEVPSAVTAVTVPVVVTAEIGPPVGAADPPVVPGAVLAPLDDVVWLTGIAVAVWLVFHGGLERLGDRLGRESTSEKRP